MEYKSGRTEDGLNSDANRKLGVYKTDGLCRSVLSCPAALGNIICHMRGK